MNLFVVGWDLPKDERASLPAALDRAAQRYPQLDPSTRWETSLGAVSACAMTWPTEALGKRRYATMDERQLFLFDGFAVPLDGTLSALDASELAPHWDDLPNLLEGQIALVRARTDPSRLEVVTDPLGLAPVYIRDYRGGAILSNSAELLADIGARPPFDELGVSTLLSCGWVGGDRTLRQGVHAIPAGARLCFDASDAGHRLDRWFDVRELAIRKPIRQPPQVIADSLVGQVRQAARALPDLRCGLTGGRDSRLVAALLVAAGARARYFTTGEVASSDVVIARELASQQGLDHEFAAIAVDDVIAEWEPASRRLVSQTDGLASLWQVADVLRQPRRAAGGRLTLPGTAGEIARGYYLHYMPDLLTLERERAPKRLARAMAQRGHGLLRDDTFALASAHVENFVTEALAAGVPVEDVSDIFYAERTWRWAGSLVRRATPVSSRFSIFASRCFVEAAFAMTARERAAEVLHRDLLRLLSPALAEHRFDRGGWRSPESPFVASPASQAPAFLQSQWLERILPLVRGGILDASRSPLWRFIDRAAFEQVSSAAAPEEERRRRAAPLYAIITLFLHERIFG